MREDWVAKKLINVCTLQRGFDLPKRLRIAGDTPLVSSSGIIDSHNKWKVQGPGVVTGRSGSIGNVFFVEDDFWPLNTVLYIKNFHGNDPRFVYYLLTNFGLERFSSGAGVPTLNRNHVHDEIVSIPECVEEQRRITAVLDEALAAISTAVDNTQRNLQNAQDLFDAYLQSIFANPGRDWEEKTLEEICENLDRMRVPITKRNRIAGEYPYYGASGIVDHVNDYIFDEDLLLVSEDGANLLARTYPIAFSVSGKIWVNNHAHVLRFKDICTQHFVEYYLNSIRLDDYVSGMAQPKLNQKSLNAIPIPIAPIPRQREIVANLDALANAGSSGFCV